MSNLKTYQKRRQHIFSLKQISEAERWNLLFNNWSDYVFNYVPKEANDEVFTKLQNEIAKT